jgi:hypothetical protein
VHAADLQSAACLFVLRRSRRKAERGFFSSQKRAAKIRRSQEARMIRKLRSGQYRLYSRKIDPRTGKRRNLGTFDTLEQAQQHERAVQFFKRRH